MLLFRVRTVHSQEVQEEWRHNSVSQTPFHYHCSTYGSHARLVLFPFLSLHGSARLNPWAPLQLPGSTQSSTPGSHRRFPLTRREFLLPDSAFVSSLYLDPWSLF